MMSNLAQAGERLVATFTAPRGLLNEAARYDSFRQCRSEGPEIYFWTQSRCLVTSGQVARGTDFAIARARSGKRGWPVLVRRSGGGTVFHDSGVLCVSLLERLPVAEAQIERVYRRFCALLTEGLSKFGVEAQAGPLPAAPCDGRFNLLAGGRKLAGTAARIALDHDGASILAHASIQVSSDFEGGLKAIESFERDVGRSARYDPECMTNLPGDPAFEQVAAAVCEALSH